MFSISQAGRMAIVAAAMIAAPALADVVVVKASGPSAAGYPAGKKLPDRSTVNLKAGDTLVLLDGRGTRTVKGPGIFGAAGPANAGNSSAGFASLVAPRSPGRARTGAVRAPDGEGAPKRNPSLWYVDMTQSSKACISDPANVMLWRPFDSAAASVTATGGGKSATIAFAAGASVAVWPAAQLPVTEGAQYALAGKGLDKPVSITFTVLPAAGGGLETTASELIARKCEAQLSLLVETVALPDPNADGPG